ncbi:Mariner Mos1 transposase [Eumeta japonica]|uniref:Mariner Mos1 transposase n=1 Tax=Eumeta variegata TaxID=151549 RepID=A0A4C1TC54_EUMVA|nr:Mariner Mos1 transposase [Eumeta japonica]
MPQKRRGKKRGVQEYILRCQKKIESLCKEKERKMELQKIKQHAKDMKNAKLLGLFEPKKKKKKVASLPLETDSDCSQNENVMTSDGEDIDVISESEDEVNHEVVNPEIINVGDFLLIKFEKKKTINYYVAKILLKYGMKAYQVSYLRKKAGSSKFVFPILEDKASVDFKDVVLQLPKPIYSKDIAASDYHLFHSMAHALSEQRFTSYEDTKNWVDSWTASKAKEFFRLGIRMLPEKFKK